jgi:hypothetical protein
MKNILLSAFLIIACVMGMKAQKFMYVVDVDGTEAAFSINNLQQLTFPGDSMMVELSDGEKTSFAFAEMAEFGFRQFGIVDDSGDDGSGDDGSDDDGSGDDGSGDDGSGDDGSGDDGSGDDGSGDDGSGDDGSGDDSQTGIDSYSLADASLYPNPVNGTLHVDFSGIDYAGNVMIKVIDLQGRTVLSRESMVNGGQSRIAIDVNNLSSGFYLCRIEINGAQSQVTFIKQ